MLYQFFNFRAVRVVGTETGSRTALTTTVFAWLIGHLVRRESSAPMGILGLLMALMRCVWIVFFGGFSRRPEENAETATPGVVPGATSRLAGGPGPGRDARCRGSQAAVTGVPVNERTPRTCNPHRLPEYTAGAKFKWGFQLFPRKFCRQGNRLRLTFCSRSANTQAFTAVNEAYDAYDRTIAGTSTCELSSWGLERWAIRLPPCCV